MDRDQFVRDMTPSFTALMAKKVPRASRIEPAVLAGLVFDQLTLCGYRLEHGARETVTPAAMSKLPPNQAGR